MAGRPAGLAWQAEVVAKLSSHSVPFALRVLIFALRVHSHQIFALGVLIFALRVIRTKGTDIRTKGTDSGYS